MKYTFIILSLLVASTASLLSSCTTCNVQTTEHSCDGGDCHQSVPKPTVSAETHSDASVDNDEVVVTSTGVLLDQAPSHNVCLATSSATCPDQAEPSNIKVEVVKGDGWEVTLPVGFQNQVVTKPNVALQSYSEKDKVLAVVLKEKFAGTFEQYVLVSLRGIRDAGAKVQSTKTVDADGKKFILVEAEKNDVKVWSLVTTKDGFGYGLSCGGPATYDNVDNFCTFVTNSFTLK